MREKDSLVNQLVADRDDINRKLIHKKTHLTIILCIFIGLPKRVQRLDKVW